VFRQLARNVVKSRLPGANQARNRAAVALDEIQQRSGCDTASRPRASTAQAAAIRLRSTACFTASGHVPVADALSHDRDHACGDHLRRDDLTLHGSMMPLAIVIDLGGVPIVKDAAVFSKGRDEGRAESKRDQRKAQKRRAPTHLKR
jgi:hypothetical protein